MRLEDQVVSLEYAKRLRELGVKQDSVFIWILATHPKKDNCKPILERRYHDEMYDNTLVADDWSLTSWSAYTVAELLDKIPFVNGDAVLLIKAITLQDGVIYGTTIEMGNVECLKDKNPANSLAKFYIYLLENNLVTLPNDASD